MLHYIKSAAKAVVRGLGYPLRVARGRPLVAVLAVVLILAAAAGAGYAYVGHQWRCAQADLVADRPADARARLGVCLWLWPRSIEVHLAAARAARLTGDVRGAELLLNQCL